MLKLKRCNDADQRSVAAAAALFDPDRAKPFTLSVATPAFDCQINALRRKAYAAARNFSLIDPSIVLRETDPDQSVCPVVSDGREIVSTLRLTLAHNRQEAERILGGEVKLSDQHFPALALCRGATDPKYRQIGLMSFLVSIAVEVAKQANLGSAFGLQFEGTPHYPAMEAAGWNRVPVGAPFIKGIYGPRHYFVYITSDRFASSISQSLRVLGQLYRRFKVQEVVSAIAEQIFAERCRLCPPSR